jgi:hypothetical protein
MSAVIQNSVDLELLIEDNRLWLYEKFISQNVQPIPSSSYPTQSSGSLISSDEEDSSTSIYRIKSSVPLDIEKSEWKFQVAYRSYEYNYYSFEFKDYIFCPAFFLASIEQSNYACIRVSCGPHKRCYYIVVKKGPENPFSDILAGHIVFKRDYIFKPPSDKQRILYLNDKHKNMVCFHSTELPRDDSVRLEWNRYVAKDLKLPHKMRSNILYWFVPKEIMSKFEELHKEVFNKSIYTIGDAALVHCNSKSYSEINDLLNPMKSQKKNTEFISKTLATIFTKTEYKREEYSLEGLLKNIQSNFSKSKVSKLKEYYCAMIPVLQSSGYGKSKLMERLGSKIPTFYSSLQHGAGYPEESFFLSRLISELNEIQLNKKDANDKCFMNNFSTAVYIYILRIIFIILIKNGGNPLKENFQIDQEIENFGPFSKISVGKKMLLFDRREKIFEYLFDGLKNLCENENSVIFDGVNTLELNNISVIEEASLNSFTVGSYRTNNLENFVMRNLKQMDTYKAGMPSIFVIDEAKGLKYNRNGDEYDWGFFDMDVNNRTFVPIDNRGPYNIFRRVFRMFTNTWERLFLIVISTSGQISVLIPDLKLDPSRREATSNKFMENFVLLQTYSVNSERASFIHADMFPERGNKILNWKEFLTSPFRIEEFFKFGRPLVYGTFVEDVKSKLDSNAYNLEETFEKCSEFWFLGMKLFGGTEFQTTTSVPLLYSMFNFAFGSNFLPPHVKREDLVENYLMTLMKYFDEKGESFVAGCYLPEGAFNVLSAKYFIKYLESFKSVISSTVKYGLCNTGHLGELLAQYVLLKTAFNCIDDTLTKIRKLAFHPITLEDFLFDLAGIEKNQAFFSFFKANPLLKESVVSFSYFEPFPKNHIERPFDLMARCLFKGSAASLNSRFLGIDLMIPLILKGGEISFLGIQVKLVKKNGVQSAINRVVDQMTFAKMFGEQESNRPFGLIILALGDYGYLKTYCKKIARQSVYSAPTILVFEGAPVKIDTSIFKLAPVSLSSCYRGVNPDILESCDHVRELVEELPQITRSPPIENTESDDFRLSSSNRSTRKRNGTEILESAEKNPRVNKEATGTRKVETTSHMMNLRNRKITKPHLNNKK